MNPNELKNRISAAFTKRESDHEQAQICLWFATEEEELDKAYFGEYEEITPVSGASVTTHMYGGGIARGGDHVDFQIDAKAWDRYSEDQKIAFAKTCLDCACDYAYEHLAAWDFVGDTSD